MVCTCSGVRLVRFNCLILWERINQVKLQTQWLSAVYALIDNKKSNMDFGVGISFPYASCKNLQSPVILDSIAATWIACQPVLAAMPKR
ncbi:MAG: hypothetical protein DRQ56_06605 [Gammaproteobacteria bacterium]|nr:MAG: hypothetical protein DRQ56_06605 [Gammaproteobacteria bacterium]RLA55339.1 MAG: hypothetical protein DRQ98_05560 [Gammaproteobacteria bacterium]